jgi:peptidoglycan/LPS O-acetylase OafA/YrhL
MMTDQSPDVRDAKSLREAQHFIALDSIRGIAALSVVLCHMDWTGIVESQGYVRNSYLMVDLFFVLSGFVIFYAYGERLKSGLDFSKFMWLRFWRLYPLHFTFLIVWLGIECLKGFFQWHFGLVANTPAFSTNNLSSFIGNLFLVQSLHLYNKGTYNGPAWSISVEFYTYILFGILILWLGSKRSTLIAAGLTCCLSLGALLLLGPKALFKTYDFGLVRCLMGFFLGLLTFALYRQLHHSRIANSRPKLTSYLALMLLTIFVLFLQFKSPGLSDLLIYPLSSAVILSIALAPHDGPTRFLSTAPFAWLGAVSYSIYMVHDSVVWTVMQVLRILMRAKEINLPAYDMSVLQIGASTGLGLTIVTMILVLAISHFTYTWIEKPFRDWSKSTWPGVRTRLMSNVEVSN